MEGFEQGRNPREIADAVNKYFAERAKKTNGPKITVVLKGKEDEEVGK